jgi:hypothetical protein
MTTTVSRYIDINVTPGVCPDTDMTRAETPHFTAADKIRFVKGRPQKIGGWKKILMNSAVTLGCVRAVFSAQLDEKLQTILGGSKALGALIGSSLNNITPLDATTIAVANSIDTHYATLANNPLSTTDGSNEVIVSDTEAALFKAGDSYVLSGATAVGGIGTSQLNKTHIVRAVDADNDQITIKASSNATSTATGGGASVVRSSGLITINDTAHGQIDGSRVKITAAGNTGGILAAEINLEFQIRNVQTDSFDVMTAGTATSSVSGGGGASTEYQQQIAAGICDETNGQGYGMGLYGVGLYGTALVSANGRRYPRIWFCDVFGDNILTTPGNQGGIYTWDGALIGAPVLVSNAPTDVNYAFVSNNILVTFGSGQRNRVKASDQGDITNWTSSSTNQVFTDDIEGAGLLRSHVSLNGTNLIFTNNQCYTFRYIGLPLIWEIKFKDNIGIIAPMARVVVKGVAYWMGENNFYEWRGGNVEVMKSNTGNESTLLNYVFQNINRGQLSKCFAWYNKRYDEIWFHYPSEGSNEIDRVARYHVTEKHWTPDTFDRLAAEYPNPNAQFPRLIDSNNNFYRHEVGNDDDESAMPWSLTTNLRDFGTDNVLNPEIVPDSIQTGNITLVAESFSYPQSPTAKNTRTITIEPTTPVSALGVDGRFVQYTLSGEALGQNWIMGKWKESIQDSSRSQ